MSIETIYRACKEFVYVQNQISDLSWKVCVYACRQRKLYTLTLCFFCCFPSSLHSYVMYVDDKYHIWIVLINCQTYHAIHYKANEINILIRCMYRQRRLSLQRKKCAKFQITLQLHICRTMQDIKSNRQTSLCVCVCVCVCSLEKLSKDTHKNSKCMYACVVTFGEK